MKNILLTITLLGATSLTMSCATLNGNNVGKSALTNPYQPGTLEHFQANRDYLYTYNSWVDRAAYDTLQPHETSVTISVSTQRGFLKKGDQVIIDYPISSGKENYETPLGTYKILEKTQNKRSNVYGKIVNQFGEVLNEDADIRETKLQPGEIFEGAEMPYWMRLTWDGIGHHVGLTPRYPASHACIRGHHQIMPLVFDKVQLGTKVHIIQ